MTLDFNTRNLQDNWKKQITYAKKNFKKDLLQQEYLKVIQAATEHKANLHKAATVRMAELDEQLKNIQKPKEPKRETELNVETVTLLNYYSKVLQSKIALQGNTQGGFLKVLNEVVEGDDDNMKWALMDSFHEVMNAGRSLMNRLEPKDNTDTVKEIVRSSSIDSQEAFESKIQEHYTLTSNKLKGPMQVKLEEENELKRSSMESERFNVNFQASQASQSLDSVVNDYQRERLYINGDAGNSSN